MFDSSTAPADPLAPLREAVSARLRTTVDDLGTSFEEVGPEVADLFDVAATMLPGGKRLRASFAATGWLALGGSRAAGDLAGAPQIVLAGTGLELFQLAALVHDDLIDGSLTRRGQPAAHRQFATLHQDRAMLDRPDRFGAAGAVLLGDLLLAAAMGELQRALDPLPPEAREAGRRIVQRMMTEVTVGQYLDIYAQSAPWSPDPARDLDRARRVIRSKSARYSVEHPLILGAAMAGADRSALAAASRIGLPVGEAFQLRDDVLGVFGDPGVTGKPAGDDLREGKRTVLVTLAMTRADAAGVDLLRGALGNADLDTDTVTRVRELLTATGALASVEELIGERTRAALAAIDAAGYADAAADLLRDLARAAISRSS
ncbi:polyprenyl synthetase family protein [Occultella glacieicola]|uniref:Polyprenyl synthetase family protein n=1 Tax=Occultella glacieicola TaxID=2518684 RepID=A0ABY2DYZ9_9MICO|nr:polyprenyl synthetase family protein [Occultella glacieicola]TDE88950.1 polyprenyl synthetase family protein [Occultella glacieicola]